MVAMAVAMPAAMTVARRWRRGEGGAPLSDIKGIN